MTTQRRVSRLHQKAVAEYASHYGSVNARGILPDSTHRDRSYQRRFGELVDALPDGSRVVDIGCGSGILLKWLAQKPNISVVGVDSSPSQLEIVEAYLPDVELHLEDGLTYLSRHAGHFSLVFCFDVLEHIPGDDNLLDWVEHVRNSLVPDGVFLCRVPNAANLLGYYSRCMDITHVRTLTRGSMLQLLHAAGFDDCSVLPEIATSWKQGLRLRAERWVHSCVYRLCGCGYEPVCTGNLYGRGIRASERLTSAQGHASGSTSADTRCD